MLEGGGILGAILEILAGSYYAIKISEHFHQRLVSVRRREMEITEAKQVLGIGDQDCFYRSDNTHPLYPKSTALHPDNFDALTTLTQYKITRASYQNKLLVTDSVEGNFERDLVLVGSPVAEGCSRIVFGYEPQPNDTDSLLLADPPVDLPYYWVLDRGRVEATAARVVAGKGVRTRPNWRIQSTLGAGRLYIPRVDSGGLLEDDYLLITRVRNYLSANALQTDKTIVTIGGTHGTGTKAIEVLLREQTVLSELSNKLKGATAYQALFRVGKIQHESFGSRASAIELLDVKILPDSDHVWSTAREKTQSKVQQWLTTPPSGKGHRKK